MKRILFVDDDVKLLHSLRRQSHPYRDQWHVSSAVNGIEALRVAREQSVDVLVTDILMPEMDGIETIRAFRKIHPSVRIIAMSGGGRLVDKGPLRIACDLGAHMTLEKPFNFEDLWERVLSLTSADSSDPTHLPCDPSDRLP